MMLRTLSTIGKGHQTHSCLIDVTLACEDATSKLVEIVPVADFDSVQLVDDSSVHI